MRLRFLVPLALASCLLPAASSRERPRPATPTRVVLWAWERDEDLRFVASLPEARRIAVAFFGSMIRVDAQGFTVRRRRHPLQLAAGTPRVAVLRIHAEDGARVVLDDALRAQIVDEARSLLALPRVGGLQLDFDARASEREAHAEIRALLRALVPAGSSFTVTSIASNCMEGGAYDRRAPDPHAEEIVPMYFAMGPGEDEVFASLRAHEGPAADACRRNAGFGVGEPYVLVASARSVYFFPRERWSEAIVERLLEAVDASGEEARDAS